MAALNHYAINQVLGAEMVPGRAPRFGRFGLLGVFGDMLRSRPRPAAKVQFDLETDRKVFDSFVKVYDGASPETLLIDKSLASQFHSTARKMGVHSSAADMNRRLLNIRKNPARYKEHGIVIPTATKTTPHPSIVARYAHVIEFALARLRSRYGVTIDDILIDPALADQYEEMARIAAPTVSSVDLRLAALYIRKTRYIARNAEKLIDSLNLPQIEAAFQEIGTVATVSPSTVKTQEGLIEILENGRHLYISRSEDLHSAVEQITSKSTLDFLANDFWRPKPENLVLRVFEGEKFLKVPVTQWQLKLIAEKRPVFNWPVAA